MPKGHNNQHERHRKDEAVWVLCRPYDSSSIKEGNTVDAGDRQIDNKFAAYKLLEILFKEGLINFATYTKIEAERKAYIESKHNNSDA